jgi:hypothetical protein
VTLAELPRRTAKAIVSPIAVRRSHREIERIASSGKIVIAGPWHAEVGFEILYWIPFLRWVRERFGLPRGRLVAISRGGAAPWYDGVAGTYFDILDQLSVEDLRALRRDHEAEHGVQKQMRSIPADARILSAVKDSLGGEEFAVLHPSTMFGLLRWFWSGAQPIDLALQHRVDSGFAPPPPASRPEGFPERYVAAKLYFSECFPDTEENREFLDRLLDAMTRDRSVVLLDTGPGIDEHRHIEAEHPGVIDARPLMTMRDNLATQTAIVAGADELTSTYGGFAYLGPHLGVPTTSFYSRHSFAAEHYDVMRVAVDRLSAGGGSAGIDVLTTTDLLDRFPDLGQT